MHALPLSHSHIRVITYTFSQMNYDSDDQQTECCHDLSDRATDIVYIRELGQELALTEQSCQLLQDKLDFTENELEMERAHTVEVERRAKYWEERYRAVTKLPVNTRFVRQPDGWHKKLGPKGCKCNPIVIDDTSVDMID